MARGRRTRKALLESTVSSRETRGSGIFEHPLRISDPDLWNSLKQRNNEVIFVFSFFDKRRRSQFRSSLLESEKEGGKTWYEDIRGPTTRRNYLVYYARYDVSKSRVDREKRRLATYSRSLWGKMTDFLVRMPE
jgi:hypothetical protein